MVLKQYFTNRPQSSTVVLRSLAVSQISSKCNFVCFFFKDHCVLHSDWLQTIANQFPCSVSCTVQNAFSFPNLCVVGSLLLYYNYYSAYEMGVIPLLMSDIFS